MVSVVKTAASQALRAHLLLGIVVKTVPIVLFEVCFRVQRRLSRTTATARHADPVYHRLPAWAAHSTDWTRSRLAAVAQTRSLVD